jgi:lysophospholipase L1-like esterase
MEKSRKNSLLGISISFLFFLFLFAISELMIGYFLPENRLDQILSVLQRDSELIWRQRPHLDTNFFGENIKTNSLGLRNSEIKSKDKKRMIVLGASPSVGWGVPNNETYSKRIENEFSSKLEVINSAQIGYSSAQGLKLFKGLVEDLRPDIVSVSYVINDVDRLRFFENNGISDDKREFVSPFVVSISNFISNFEVVRLLKRLLSLSKGPKSSKKVELSPRVSLEVYEKNLKEFISLSKKYNFHLIFVKMPVNLPTKFDNKNGHSNYQLISTEASTHAKRYNNQMEIIAKNHNIALVDIVKRFKTHEGPYLFVDPKLDTIHPNGLGHGIIANEISAYLRGYISSLE